MKHSIFAKAKYIYFLLLFTILLTGCSSISQKESMPANSAAAFDQFTSDFFRSEVATNTINLHYTLSDPKQYGIEHTPISLGTISDESASISNAQLENTLSVLADFDYDSLSLNQQLTYDVLSDSLHTVLTDSRYALYQEYLNPSSGIQAQLPILYAEYKFYTEEDVKNYLALLPLTKQYFQEIISFEKKKAAAGLFMSDDVCDKVIAQCSDFTLDTDNHYLVLSFQNRIDAMSILDDSAKEMYKTENKTLLDNYVFPAYDELALSLTKLRGQGENNLGICYFPEGRSYYKSLVYRNTGCSLPVEDIQTMIDNKRFQDLQAQDSLLKENPNLWKQCTEVSITSVDSLAALEHLQTYMQKQFPEPPETTYTVNFIDECMQEYLAPAFYITAPIDNYTSNSIYINPTTNTSTIHYFTTLAHEGFPGHLYQTVMSYEAGLPPVRSILNYPGYVEGWATYVEMISYQYANLPEDAAALMAFNQSALLSLYASSDIGIHYDGWTLSDTIKFWKDYGINNPDAIAEIYQYILSEPANYLMYYVGYLQFLDLKEYARETYGSYYSDIAFHRAVLSIGPAPFSIVKKYLPEYYVPED